MNDRPNDTRKQNSRDERLRAALRANLQRRKAQMRMRAAQDADEPQTNGSQNGNTGRDDG